MANVELVVVVMDTTSHRKAGVLHIVMWAFKSLFLLL